MKYLLIFISVFLMACEGCQTVDADKNWQEQLKEKDKEIQELRKELAAKDKKEAEKPVDKPEIKAEEPAYKPKPKTEKKVDKPAKINTNKEHFGLYNKGNTCFLNATTQALFASSLLVDIIDEKKLPEQHYQERVDLLNALKELKTNPKDQNTALNNYFTAYKAANKAINNTKQVGGKGGGKITSTQCDAMDFLNSTLDILGYYIKTHRKTIFKDPTLVPRYRYGDNDKTISLGVPKDNEQEESLDYLFKEWLYAPEEMTGDNQVYDDNEKKQDAQIYNIIEELPKTFFISLKRYRYDTEKNKEFKVLTKVLPAKLLTFDIGDKEKKEVKALLKSIVIQSGNTRGGHYYAYIFNQKEKAWYKHDDSSVSKVSEEEAFKDASTNGYIYGYELL